MRITTTRRISQAFFVTLLVWFCLVATIGEHWWQLRGWPVNWLLQLDPLVGLSTLLTTGTVYSGLLWGLATLALTLLLGRFFCGWVCPFGAIHQLVGYLGRRRAPMKVKLQRNRYRPAQAIKYYVLIFLLTVAAAEAALSLLRLGGQADWRTALVVVLILALVIAATVRGSRVTPRRAVVLIAVVAGSVLAAHLLLAGITLPPASLQIGLLDPLPLVQRSINLVLLPLWDRSALPLAALPRHYADIGLMAAIFVAAVLLNLYIPRFYCRFVCPLGALLGVCSRHALWRIGKKRDECIDCHLCEKNCEGACEPTARIRWSECVLCLNCLDDCRHGLMDYRTSPSAAGEVPAPEVSRRGFLVASVSGVAAIPMLRLDGLTGANWQAGLIRPPGALAEEEFLARCLKCGQCMRICPTNVIHPAGWQFGLEGLWTPRLNFRIGTSGCQFNCIACAHVCPTAAIRPISLKERLGRGAFAEQGPIRIGTAFVDRGRCLPWAMDRPCIVCQENCPVSPKAIITREVFQSVSAGPALTVRQVQERTVVLADGGLVPGRFASGDYHLRLPDQHGDVRWRIVANQQDTIEVASEPAPAPAGSRVEIQVRLQRPYVDPARCIGCGVCEHECPVPGLRAVRVTADNQSRERKHALLLQR